MHVTNVLTGVKPLKNHLFSFYLFIGVEDQITQTRQLPDQYLQKQVQTRVHDNDINYCPRMEICDLLVILPFQSLSCLIQCSTAPHL